MNKIIILFFSFSLLLFSCNSEKRKVSLKCDNAEGISSKTKLTVNGFQIGMVKGLQLTNKGEVIISVEYDNDIKIPKNSRFISSQISLMGYKTIEVILGDNKEVLNEKDTMSLEIKKVVGNKIFNLIDKTIEKSLNNKDSLLIELRKLNKELEKLNEK